MMFDLNFGNSAGDRVRTRAILTGFFVLIFHSQIVTPFNYLIGK